jgi:hypothetical protein
MDPRKLLSWISEDAPQGVDLGEVTEISRGQPTGRKRKAVLIHKDKGWVVHIDGTPGSWYLSTLLNKEWGDVSDTIYVDYGQQWAVTGMLEVIRKAAVHVAGGL